MSLFTELLGLNQTDVKNVVIAYTGYARAMEKNEYANQESQLSIASSWLIGALFETLILPSNSKIFFAQAARIYKHLNLPIWIICNLCSGSNDLRGMNISNTETQSEEELFYMALQENFNEETNGHYHYLALAHNINGKIHGLDIPYTLVLKAIEDIKSSNYTTVLSDRRRFYDVLQRLAEKIEQYRADKHWKNLEGPILPFEPTALAIMLVMVKLWKQKNGGNFFYTGDDPNKTVLIGIANELINNQ